MKTLWIVDDSSIILELLEHTIQEFFNKQHIDLGIKTFDRAYKAYEYSTSNEKPDLIITDIEMPKMTGIEFIAKLRGDNYNEKIIVITGASDKDSQEINLLLAESNDRLNSDAFDATEIWEKPVEMEKLMNELKRCLVGSD